MSLREVDLETYARDMWPRMLLGYREGHKAPARPHAIVWPEQVDEVVAVVKLARAQRIPIAPYGGGSGVCGGAVPILGGITIDTKRMQPLRAVHAAELRSATSRQTGYRRRTSGPVEHDGVMVAGRQRLANTVEFIDGSVLAIAPPGRRWVGRLSGG